MVGDDLSWDCPASNPGLQVAGIIAYSIPSRGGDGDLLISLADAKARFGATDASLWALRRNRGDPARLSRRGHRHRRDPGGTALTADDLAGDLSRSLDRLIGLFDALALISVLIAGLGIVNTLSVGVIERVREIAILRSHGMTVRQVQAMVVAEGAIMGTMGGLAAAAPGCSWPGPGHRSGPYRTSAALPSPGSSWSSSCSWAPASRPWPASTRPGWPRVCRS